MKISLNHVHASQLLSQDINTNQEDNVFIVTQTFLFISRQHSETKFQGRCRLNLGWLQMELLPDHITKYISQYYVENEVCDGTETMPCGPWPDIWCSCPNDISDTAFHSVVAIKAATTSHYDNAFHWLAMKRFETRQLARNDCETLR